MEVAEKLKPDDTEENRKRAALSELAEVHLLDKHAALSLPEQYAAKFGQDPDEVWAKEFDDVMVWIYRWKDVGEYTERYRLVEKSINDTK